MAVSVDLDKALDKAYEGKPLKEILDASPAALAGVSDADAEHLTEPVGVAFAVSLGLALELTEDSRARRSGAGRSGAGQACATLAAMPEAS